MHSPYSRVPLQPPTASSGSFDQHTNQPRDKHEQSALLQSSTTTAYVIPPQYHYDSQHQHHDDDDADHQEVKHKTYFVYLCILVNTIAFVISMGKNHWKFEALSTNPMLGPSAQVLLDMGAKQADYITQGQWWRLFLPQILHAGLLHLALNMIMLYRIGRSLEKVFGFYRICIIYFVSGVSGVLGSSLFLPQIIGVGASGALYGLLGSLFADFCQNYKMFKENGGHYLYLCSLTINTALGLGCGILPLVDNFAHVFGFLAGFFMGLIFLSPKCFDCCKRPGAARYATRWTELLVFVGIVVLIFYFFFGFYILYTHKNARDWCKFCRYISCVETPYWTCPSVTPMCQYSNRNGTYVAPC